MTPEERRKKLREILEAHDAAAREFRRASSDAGLKHMRATLDAIHDSHVAMERAVDAMLAANQAARELDDEDRHE